MLRSVAHIALAFVVLLSSTGLSVNMHFCHEHLVDIAVMAPAKSCCEVDEGMRGCCTTEFDGANNHCKDESISVDTADDYLQTTFSFSFRNDIFQELQWMIAWNVAVTGQNNPLDQTWAEYRKPPTSEVSQPDIQAFRL